MKSKVDYLPVIVMLAAGLITCIFIIIYDYELSEGLTALTAALIIFYIIGKIIRVIAMKKLTTEGMTVPEDDEPKIESE